MPLCRVVWWGSKPVHQRIVVGAMAVIRYAKKHGTKIDVARSTSGATSDQGGGYRTCQQQDCADAWAIMVRGERYKEPKLLAAA